MQDYRKLIVWQKAHHLVLAVYEHTAAFPKHERYGLTSQMRRCSNSVTSNIAEGCGRNSRAQFYSFLEVAVGSAWELEYQLLLARDLQYLNEDAHAQMHHDVEEVKRMLTALLNKVGSLRRKNIR